VVVRKVGAQTLKVDRKVDGAILMKARKKMGGVQAFKTDKLFFFFFFFLGLMALKSLDKLNI